MPILNLKLAGAPAQSDLGALARELTTLTHESLGKRAEVTAVVIESVPVARWFVGGEALQQASAQLDIRVTEGSNSPAEKADFVARASALLNRHLQGQMHAVSYVSVLECPASDWGYGGWTQAARRLAGTDGAKRA